MQQSLGGVTDAALGFGESFQEDVEIILSAPDGFLPRRYFMAYKNEKTRQARHEDKDDEFLSD